MKILILYLFILSFFSPNQWVLPETIKLTGSFLPKEKISTHNFNYVGRLLEDAEFYHCMEILDDLGKRCIEQAAEGSVYEIQFYTDPSDSHLHQSDLFQLVRDLDFSNLQHFHQRLNDLLISLDRISIKYPETSEYTIDDWIILLNQFHRLHPELLWRSSNTCDDLCMAEAYAEFVSTAAALAAGVLSTSALPPLSALIAFGGSVFTVLRFINRLRKCCE